MARVYLVGAGPGAADLLTVRAARLIERADIIFYDALVGSDVLALARHAELVAVGKRCGAHSTAQHFINRRLIDAARRHGTVVRLKGGDPMLFGRAQEEIDALWAAGVEVEVVAGVTAALAASASLQVSLTRRDEARSVVFATPRIGTSARAGNWLDPVIAADTAVLYMAAGEWPGIAAALLQAGKPESLPVALVFGASLPGERVEFTTLGSAARQGESHAADAGGELPGIVLIGSVYAGRSAAELAAGSTATQDTCNRRRQGEAGR